MQYKQDRIFRASVNLQLVMVLNYLYAAYNLLIGLQSGSMWLLSLGIYTLMLAIVRTDLTLSHHRGRKLPPGRPAAPRIPLLSARRVVAAGAECADWRLDAVMVSGSPSPRCPAT